jgi:hypothetical protein
MSNCNIYRRLCRIALVFVALAMVIWGSEMAKKGVFIVDRVVQEQCRGGVDLETWFGMCQREVKPGK